MSHHQPGRQLERESPSPDPANDPASSKRRTPVIENVTPESDFQPVPATASRSRTDGTVTEQMAHPKDSRHSVPNGVHENKTGSRHGNSSDAANGMRTNTELDRVTTANGIANGINANGVTKGTSTNTAENTNGGNDEEEDEETKRNNEAKERKAPGTRKKYVLTKRREYWTDEEHKRFLAALSVYGREWKAIEREVGTKSAVQVRSHAQKWFLRLQRNNPAALHAIPPPRPRRSRNATAAAQPVAHAHAAPPAAYPMAVYAPLYHAPTHPAAAAAYPRMVSVAHQAHPHPISPILMAPPPGYAMTTAPGPAAVPPPAPPPPAPAPFPIPAGATSSALPAAPGPTSGDKGGGAGRAGPYVATGPVGTGGPSLASSAVPPAPVPPPTTAPIPTQSLPTPAPAAAPGLYRHAHPHAIPLYQPGAQPGYYTAYPPTVVYAHPHAQHPHAQPHVTATAHHIQAPLGAVPHLHAMHRGHIMGGTPGQPGGHAMHVQPGAQGGAASQPLPTTQSAGISQRDSQTLNVAHTRALQITGPSAPMVPTVTAQAAQIPTMSSAMLTHESYYGGSWYMHSGVRVAMNRGSGSGSGGNGNGTGTGTGTGQTTIAGSGSTSGDTNEGTCTGSGGGGGLEVNRRKRDLGMLLNAHEYLEKDNKGSSSIAPGSSPKRRARSGHRCQAMEIAELTSHRGVENRDIGVGSALHVHAAGTDAAAAAVGSGGGSGNEADVDTNSSNSGDGESHERRRHKARHVVK